MKYDAKTANEIVDFVKEEAKGLLDDPPGANPEYERGMCELIARVKQRLGLSTADTCVGAAVIGREIGAAWDNDSLAPPDLERCQAEIKGGSFMTLGPRSYARCKEKPTCIATENKPGKDSEHGSMSLCAECAKVFLEKMGKKYATLTQIKKGDA